MKSLIDPELLSPASQRIKPTPIRALSSVANVLRDKGKWVIENTMGEPSHPIAIELANEIIEKIAEAAGFKRMAEEYGAATARKIFRKHALSENLPGSAIGYGPFHGLQELRERVAVIESRALNTEVTAANVMMLAGGSNGLELGFSVLAKPGMVDPDTGLLYVDPTTSEAAKPGTPLIVNAPYFPIYSGLAAAKGLPLYVINTRDTNFLPDPDRFGALVDDLGGRAIGIFNTTNNPSGIYADEGHLKALTQMVEDKEGLTWIDDDIYAALARRKKGERPVRMYDLASPEARARGVKLISGAKEYAAAGLRGGYLVGDPAVVAPMGPLNLVNGIIHPSILSQLGVVAAAEKAPERYKEIQQHYADNTKMLLQALRPLSMVDEGYDPDGNIYALINGRVGKGQTLSKKAMDILREIDEVLPEGLSVVPSDGKMFIDWHFVAALAADYGVIAVPESPFEKKATDLPLETDIESPAPRMEARILTVHQPEDMQEMIRRLKNFHEKAMSPYKSRPEPIPPMPKRELPAKKELTWAERAKSGEVLGDVFYHGFY